MGQFEPKRKKSGGRQKGTPNKTTKELKDTINAIVSKGLDYYLEDIQKIRTKNPEKAFELTQKLIDYVLPKQQKIDLEGDINHTVNKVVIEIKKKDGKGNKDTDND